MGNSLSTTFVPNWDTACAAKFNCTSFGLVDLWGHPMVPVCSADVSQIPSEVWGISAQVCYASCGTMRQSIDFTTSAITMTTWLLPWLALIAQLPFEATGWMNLLSGCLAVGSPALATYSLALTAFNRRYAFRKFRGLKDKVQRNTRQAVYGWMIERLDKAAFIVVEVQQCPMRANQRDGEFASLLTINDLDRNIFWKVAHKDLKNTRRGFTYSFLAQVLMAALSYLLSFIAAFHDSFGSPQVCPQFVSSMVWTWMFPVLYGYIQVGTQDNAVCIKEALTDARVDPDDFGHQTGLFPDADLYLPLARHRPCLELNLLASTSQISTVAADSEKSQHTICHSEPASPPTWFGFDIRGDERREGPIFNYARIFTWFAFTKHVHGGFHSAISKFQHHASIPLTPEDAAAICDLEPQQDLVAFEGRKDISTTTIHHILGAALIACFLQWGITGAAIYAAYRIPPIGLGCRSGSYLLYGAAATVSWILLVLANLASHAYMHRFEQDPEKPISPLLGALAVVCRLSGKGLAICNAFWIIASTVLEDIGAFQNCWCQTSGLSLAQNGWVPIFKTGTGLRYAEGGPWIGGFVWSITVCVVTMAIFSYHQPPRS
ncbi:hypothetical protein FB45DRAFT_379373 [Roridomyces roridus]|uniref:Uncharacterized protein n=1 Tax=Roridomyces roridus TaxID=1738132 RepID=A0AAD7FBB5_9AGAR|nr:hypothetical protein FB45DRAFT_379373 [Roridomyces roridus]